MNYNDLEFLTRLYNTLLLINTRGEDTIIMGDCLKSLQNFVLTKKQESVAADNMNAQEE